MTSAIADNVYTNHNYLIELRSLTIPFKLSCPPPHPWGMTGGPSMADSSANLENCIGFRLSFCYLKFAIRPSTDGLYDAAFYRIVKMRNNIYFQMLMLPFWTYLFLVILPVFADMHCRVPLCTYDFDLVPHTCLRPVLCL